MEYIEMVLVSIWATLKLMAPYLLFGYLMAGILSLLITPETVERHLGGEGIMSTIKAAVFGMPLPLCSCGVIPVTASLRQHGAGRGATVSFLISTPTTGVDSIMAAWGLMGPVFAIYRAIMAVIIGIFGGILANFFGRGDDESEYVRKEGEPCCEAHAKMPERISFIQKLGKGIKYGFYSLPKDIGKELAIGIFLAGLISALVNAGVLTQFLGSGIGTMFIMLIVGIPLYVCATASIPFALSFMALGASPGAALVFLVAGPATNAATLTVLWKMIGKRPTIAVLVAIAIGALLGGIVLDNLWAFWELPDVTQKLHEHTEHSDLLPILSAIALILVQLYSGFYGRVAAWLSGGKVVVSCCSHDSQGADEHAQETSSCCSHTPAKEPAYSHGTSGCCGSHGNDNAQADKSDEADDCCSEKKSPCCGSHEKKGDDEAGGSSCCSHKH